MAHIVTGTDNYVFGPFASSALATAWRNAQGTPANYTVVDTGSVAIPSWFIPGETRWVSSAFTLDRPTLTTEEQLKAGFRAQVDRIRSLGHDIFRAFECGGHPEWIYKWGMNAVNGAKRFSYGMALSTTISNANKLGWLLQSANGPTDAPTDTVDNRSMFISNASNVLRAWTDQQRSARSFADGVEPIVTVCGITSPYTRNALADLRDSSDGITGLAVPSTAEDYYKIEQGTYPADITA